MKEIEPFLKTPQTFREFLLQQGNYTWIGGHKDLEQIKTEIKGKLIVTKADLINKALRQQAHIQQKSEATAKPVASQPPTSHRPPYLHITPEYWLGVLTGIAGAVAWPPKPSGGKREGLKTLRRKAKAFDAICTNLYSMHSFLRRNA